MFLIDPIRNFYGRFERPISSLSLIGGFVFDALTLKRVDTLWENLWVLGHLLIIGIFIILIHTRQIESGDETNPSKAHFWYVNILQFFFGGILSTYLVFYFRSGDFFVSWPFIALLAFAFIANESFKKHYVRLSFQITLFFLSIYLFVIFLVPVVLHRINTPTFILSGIITLAITYFFIKTLFYFVRDKFSKSKLLLFSLISGIFAIINVLYFTNLIPPIPLSLKDGGVYHTIHKNPEKNYVVTYEDLGWRGFFNMYPDFHTASDSPIYAFSAVFSPKDLNIDVLHEWQHYDEEKGEWITDKIIKLPVIGGRDGGFRTYSKRSNLADGKWKVSVKTQSGHTIGSIRFNVINDSLPVNLSTKIK